MRSTRWAACNSAQTGRRAVVPGAKGPGRAAALVSSMALLLIAAACKDPRPRPTGPTVQVSLAPRTVVASPGPLTGSVDIYDANGLDSIRITLSLGNGSTLADSTYFPSGSDPFTYSEPLLFQLPGGIPQHTAVRVVAWARSYIGLFAADTALTAVGDTL